MTRAAKRDVDKGALRETWKQQASMLGFSAEAIHANARQAERDGSPPDLSTQPGGVAGDAARWAVEHLSERQAVFGHRDLLAATLGRDPGAVSAAAAERAIAALEHKGGLHAARGLDHGRHWTTDAALARESETISLMRNGQGAERAIMRGWVAETKLHRGGLNEGQKAAVKTVLAAKDRVIGVQGYAGTGKTTMLKRLRALAESRGHRVVGLAPSASAARTLEQESGIASETLQRFLARHAGVIGNRGTTKGLRNLRSQFAKTVLVVDESSLASSEQMRGVLRAATTLRLARVVLVGDEKQLGAVEAGKPFAQLRAAGMRTVVMDEIVRQRDTELKEAVRASLAGEVRTAFAKLGGHIAQVEKSELGTDAAARWLRLPPDQRAATGVIAPTRALRDEINETIRTQMVAEGVVAGPAREVEKAISRGLTRAQMTVAANYAPGDTVIFNRAYKTLGVAAGDERRVVGVDRQWKRVDLADDQDRIVKWTPERLAAAKGGVEVYRGAAMELRAGDRVRWTRNDPSAGLVNGATATVEGIERGGVRFRLEDGTVARLADDAPQLRHLDRAWAATLHAFQGRTVDRIIAAMPADHPKLSPRSRRSTWRSAGPATALNWSPTTLGNSPTSLRRRLASASRRSTAWRCRPHTRPCSALGTVRNAAPATYCRHRMRAPAATKRGARRRRNAVAHRERPMKPAATATETCRNRAPGATVAAGNPATMPTVAAVRTGRDAKPESKSRWNRRRNQSTSTSACSDTAPVASARPSGAVSSGHLHRNRCGLRCFRNARARGSRNGRIPVAIPAREPVGEPGHPVCFVTGRTWHRTHVRPCHQTRPVAGHATPRDRLPPGRFPKHSGGPPFGVPTARTGRGRHAKASNGRA